MEKKGLTFLKSITIWILLGTFLGIWVDHTAVCLRLRARSWRRKMNKGQGEGKWVKVKEFQSDLKCKSGNIPWWKWHWDLPRCAGFECKVWIKIYLNFLKLLLAPAIALHVLAWKYEPRIASWRIPSVIWTYIGKHGQGVMPVVMSEFYLYN